MVLASAHTILGQSLRATLSVFLFSVPIMMVIMGTMTAITGGVNNAHAATVRNSDV